MDSIGQSAPPLRIGDRERLTAVQDLTRHCSEGRLSLDELDLRIDQAWTARTEADLESLLADLPPSPPAQTTSQTWQSWLADGKALFMTLPPRVVWLASGTAVVFLFFAFMLLAFHDHGFGYPGPGHDH